MTKKYGHALVIGKFYPPHNGHIHMISGAEKLADRVTVLVYSNQYQSITVDQKVNWIRESFKDVPNVRIEPVINDVYDDYVDLNIWEAHNHIMHAKLRELYPNEEERTINVVVSSEAYGAQMAEDFPNCAAEIVDLDRAAFPISGTACRDDLYGNWKYLPLGTRRGLIPRVIVLGAESTGTTTLALALAEHYGARYVPEYGREYTVEWLSRLQRENPTATMEDLNWEVKDFNLIGNRQTVLEDAAANQLEGFPLVLGDTDAFATAIWEARYVPETKWEDNILKPYATNLPSRNLYLLTDHVGVDFEEDGYRDGEAIRADMSQTFEDALTKTGKSWVLLRGTHEERMKVAVKMIDRLLLDRATFK